MSKQKERRRVSAQDVRDNARKGGGGSNWFKLPEGITLLEVPDKAITITLDILPYEVKSDNHPDKQEPGTIWYKMPFYTHKNIGASNESVVCPTSLGRPCPICEVRKELVDDDYNKNKKQIVALNYQNHVIYNAKNPADEDAVVVFHASRGKFPKQLEKELVEGDDGIQCFYDCTDVGKTLKVRFSEETFSGDDGKPATYFGASRIDFLDREAMDEDEVLGKTACLEECLDVMSYDKLKSLFLQLEPEAPEKGSTGKATPTAPAPSTKSSGAGAKKEKPITPAAAVTESGKFSIGDTVTFTNSKKETITGKIIEVDDEDVVVEDAKGKEHDAEMEDLEAAEETEETEEAPAPAKASAKTPAKAPAATAGDGELVVGDQVRELDGKGKPTGLEGEIIKIKDDDVTIKNSDGGGKVLLDADDLEKIEAEGGGEPRELQPGDEVTWDDEDEEGEVVKVKEGKVRVKDAKGNLSWQPADEVKLKE